MFRLVTGCSWTTAGRLSKGGQATLHRRRDEWLAAGVFGAVCAEALAGYDRVIGLDLSEVSIDASLHKAPCGGEGIGANPTDRGKLGWRWSIATDRDGIPLGLVRAHDRRTKPRRPPRELTYWRALLLQTHPNARLTWPMISQQALRRFFIPTTPQ